MSKVAALLAATALVGCGLSDDAVTGDGGIDARPDAGPCTGSPTTPSWAVSELHDTVSQLSGDSEIADGVRLSNRATAANRDLTRQWLRDRLTALGLTPHDDDYGTGTNVYAEVPGDDEAAPRIVLGAHFDSVMVSPGADDNATGVAIALAVAHRLVETPCRRVPVIVAFFDEEEQGLIGSSYFARRLFLADAAIGEVHTVDQAGWDHDGDRVFELELPTPALLVAYQAVAAGLGVEVSATSTPSSDHDSFRERGYPAVGITEEFVGGDTTPFYHSAGDTFDTVQLDYTLDGFRLIGETIVRGTGSTPAGP